MSGGGITVLACGGRNYANRTLVEATLDLVAGENGGIKRLVHGAANGADTLAGAWALERGVKVQTYPAQWKLYGWSAGPVRNSEMLREEKVDIVVAFPGGTGTADMVTRARAKGIRIVEVKE